MKTNLSRLVLATLAATLCLFDSAFADPNPVPGYLTCNQVRGSDRARLESMGRGPSSQLITRFAPHPLDSVLFTDGPVTYQAPLGAFSHVTEVRSSTPTGINTLYFAGLVAKHQSNSSLVGVKVVENGQAVDITTLPPFNTPVKIVVLANGTNSYVPVPANSTFVLDYQVQIRQAMTLGKRLLAAYGLDTTYVSNIIITFRDPSLGRPFILSDIFSNFPADQRPSSMTKGSRLIDDNYACELIITAHRDERCAREWYR